MAAQLGIVAYKLIEDAVVSLANDARGRGSWKKKMMNEMKDKIDEFHNSLEGWEKREHDDQGTVTFEHVLEEVEKQLQQKDQEFVKGWLVDVKDIYYEVIDLCKKLIGAEEIAVREWRNATGLPCSYIARQCCSVQIRDEMVKMAHGILKKVEAVKDEKGELEELLGPKDRFVVDPGGSSQAKLYARDKEKRKLISWMLHSLEDVRVICIVGRTGIGKSALAQHAYDEVKDEFHIAAWVSVSAEFNSIRVAEEFVAIVSSKKINKQIGLESLTQMVHESINGRKYLLVLDGLQDHEYFESERKKLKEEFFNCGGLGCVILVTTHQEHDVVKETTVIKMPLHILPEEGCWSIIEHEAFGTAGTMIKDTIENIRDAVGKELAKKCQGLPVIAKAIGGILRGRTSLGDWKTVLESYVWGLSPTDNQPENYYSLPRELKQCLLYCSIFPKNHIIDVNQLINLWMAMDSIGLDEATMETKGRDLFNALLDRSIFHDYSQQEDSGSYECKLQGSMSDFIINYLAQNECQIIRLNEAERTDKRVSENVRHCTLHVSPEASLPASISNSKKLHTLMVLSENSSFEPANLSSLLSKMRRLRALVFSNCSMTKLPTEACELWYLRYLDLSFNHKLKKLPLEICNLFNLQTLTLNGCDELQKLPESIGKLTKLRHLDILWTTNLSYLPKALTRLVSLTRLSRFFETTGADRKACKLEDMEHLKNLQGCISIEGLRNRVSEAQKAGLSEKIHLRGLELRFSVGGSKDNHEVVLENLGAPPQLECLGIFYYRGSSFPSWIVELGKLTRLILSDCGECDTLPALGRLESLETLEIKNLARVTQVGSQFLVGGTESESESLKGAFPKLEKLYFQKLENWETWEDQAGDTRAHMPQLAFLSIEGCPKLRTLPNYITKSTRLKILWPDKNSSQQKVFKSSNHFAAGMALSTEGEEAEDCGDSK